jgi:uncharacterized protein
MSARFSGYAAIFDEPDHGGDIVRRGAFARGACAPLPLYRQHDMRRRIGTIEALTEDDRGLRVTGALRPGEVLVAGDGLSFGYRVRGARSQPISGRTFRELIDLDLIEVSVVSHPMQPLARVLAVHEGEDDGL